MIKRTLLLAYAVFLIALGVSHAQQPGNTVSGPAMPQAQTGTATPAPVGTPQLTSSQGEMLQRLTPEQRRAVEDVRREKGDALTPEAMETLRTRPEFKGLAPQDILQGKEMLEKKETEKKEPAKKPLGEATPEKRVIGMEKADQSLFERVRAIGKYQEISTDLKPFGFDFFQEAAIKVLTDRKDIPVPTDYIIGPGDEVKILMWGRVNSNYNLVVDRNGNITMPQVGPIPVAGLTFEQMSKHLIKQADQFVGANIDVTMGALKSIPVFVLGDVKRPGAYTVGSFATMTDALLIAGGPTGIGSMRNVQLKRKDKIVTAFDLYDLLLRGDKSRDTVLQAGDVVFVPVAGPIIGIAGNVKRPAIYELRGKYDLETLFDLAGGIIPTAYTQQIQIERVVKNERQIIVDIDDKKLAKTKDFHVQDFDLVKIFNIVEKEGNVIFLSGNVKRPGKYEYKPGMRIRDVLKDEKELLPETYYEYAVLKRIDPPTFGQKLIPFSLGTLFGPSEHYNIELRPQDSIYIFSKWFFKDRPFVVLEGEVRGVSDEPRTGERRRLVRLPLSDNMTVRDAILAAGGLTQDAHLDSAELYRTDDVKKDISLVKFDLKKALDGDEKINVVLKDNDRIVIQSVWGFVYKQTVSVDGEVLRPGSYVYVDNMKLKDVIFAAGSVLESAYLEEAEITSQSVDEERTIRLTHKNINLKRALMGEPADNVILKPYDRLTVKRLHDWRKERFVTVGGEVRFSGRYVTKKTERLSALIERAGGYTDEAYLRGATFTRPRVKDLQQKSLDEMIARMEREMLAESSTVTATSTEGVQAKQAEILQRQRFIETLRKLQPTGRMTIYLTNLRLLKGSEYDIELEEGDSLFIPTKNSVVNVAGAVMANGSFVYNDSVGYEDYIRMAGGYSRYADTDNVFVLKVDGSARKMSSSFVNWNPFKKRWEAGGFGEGKSVIEAGDSIVIPEKLERTAWLRDLKDITQIVANVGLSAASIALLYKTLNP